MATIAFIHLSCASMQCHVQQRHANAIDSKLQFGSGCSVQLCKYRKGPGFTAPCSPFAQVSVQARVNNCQMPFTSCAKRRVSFKVHGPFPSRKVCLHTTGRLHINTRAAVAHQELRCHFTTSPNTPCGFGRHSVNSAVFTLPLIECKSTVGEGSTGSRRRRCHGDRFLFRTGHPGVGSGRRLGAAVHKFELFTGFNLIAQEEDSVKEQ